MFFKSQKQIDKEFEKEYALLESVLLAHDFYREKLYTKDSEGYERYMERQDKAHKIADMIDNDIIKPFFKDFSGNLTNLKKLKPSFGFACGGAASMGIGIGLQLCLGDPISMAIGAGVELISVGLIGNFFYKFFKEYKFKLAQIDKELRWGVLKYIPAYTEGFLRVNNIEQVDIFGDGVDKYQVKGKIEGIHDPLKEDKKTREEIRSYLKLAHLDGECEI